MDRRDFLKYSGVSGAATLAGLSLPTFAQEARVLKVVAGDLASFDPIASSALLIRNAALLVWDTLYGVDENMVPQRQMVESETVSDDSLVWTFTLRPGLIFHDGTPVSASDVVASLRRWAGRDIMGRMIAEVEVELIALDDRTFRWTLSEPFVQMLFALAKPNAPCTFIMPERIAQTDPFEQITEYIGSGPMRFVESEWRIGAQAVFERFEDYVPRDEPSAWLAGGKVMHIDRIEWIVIPDGATAVAALQSAEVDWVETPLVDLLPLLETNTEIALSIQDTLGSVPVVRLNHLHAPFSDNRVRTALMMALSQDDYMTALVGTDRTKWQPMIGYFTPETPLYNEAGGEVLTASRDLDAAKALIEEAGQTGAPVTLLVGDDPTQRAMGDVTADLLNRLGFTVDYVATDSATVQTRRQSKAPLSEGGWSIFHTTHNGADCVNPAAHLGLRANGDDAWYGWPTSEVVEAGIAEWFAATNDDAAMAAAVKINRAALEAVVYAPAGFFYRYRAVRSGIQGVRPAPAPLFWDVTLAV